MSAALRILTTVIAAPVLALGPSEFPVSDVSVRAQLRPPSREVRGRLGTSVDTPFGHLPVSGRVAATHTCDGEFNGSIHYSLLIRIGAGLKGVRLVNAVEGRLASRDSSTCELAADISGRFTITDSTLAGVVEMEDRFREVRGIVRGDGDTAYHVVIVPQGGAPGDSAFVSMYSR